MILITISIITAILLMIIGGVSKSIMDTLNFKYDSSMFAKIPIGSKWRNWLNSPANTCGNKYKNGDKEQGPAFIGSTTYFIFITDGWHFFQSLMLNCFELSMTIFMTTGLYLYFNLGIYYFFVLSLSSFIMFKLIFSLSFELFWSKIWNK